MSIVLLRMSCRKSLGYNYIAIPSVLVGYAIRYLRKKSMEWVGVLEIDEYGRLFFVTEAFQNKDPDYQSKTILGYNSQLLGY